jgi:hypothetical protein
MARRPHLVLASQREARQQEFNAAPVVDDHAGVSEVRVELKFADPEGKQQPSPRAASYSGDMHMYFHFACPMRDCAGGGFDAHDDLLKAVARRNDGHTGTRTCQGTRTRPGNKVCGIELHYTLTIRGKAKAA